MRNILFYPVPFVHITVFKKHWPVFSFQREPTLAMETQGFYCGKPYLFKLCSSIYVRFPFLCTTRSFPFDRDDRFPETSQLYNARTIYWMHTALLPDRDPPLN